MSPDPRVNRLSLARMFLFGARDVWFVVGVPVYFQMVLSDGTPEGRRWAFFVIGGFLALWIILYGAVQAAAPRILGGDRAAMWWKRQSAGPDIWCRSPLSSPPPHGWPGHLPTG